jgi:RNA-binding protein 15
VQASRTLFLGNLTYEVTEKDIRRVFERYGKLGGVEIKRPADGATPYAFIFYSVCMHTRVCARVYVCVQTVKQALEAKKIENDRPLRDGQPRVRVGWGKSVPCQRLWVHGLGEWVNEEQLFREFDRYGVIDKVDYAPPADHAYITFDSIQSATDACNAMKNFELGGKDRKIRVDFALP